MGANDSENRLTARQVRALESLTTGSGSISDAAKAAGVSRKTLYRWLQEPAFATELRKLEAIALKNLTRRIVALSDLAADTLTRALDPSQPIGSQLRAAAIVAERAPQLFELTSLNTRLEELEADIHAADSYGAFGPA